MRPQGPPPKKEMVQTVLGGSAILKVFWEGKMLYFPGLGISNRTIWSENSSGVFPDLFWILLRKWKCSTVLGAPPNKYRSAKKWEAYCDTNGIIIAMQLQ